MKNYSELIKSKSERTLTAKGNSFVWKCIDIVADMNGLCRYDKRLKELKDQLRNILYFLILDKEMSLQEIKQLIKESKLQTIKIQ